MPADTNRVTSQISAPIRIIALIGVLSALAMGGWIFTQGQKTSAPTQLTPTPSSAIAQANAVAGKLNAHNLATAAAKPAAVAAAAAAKPKPAVAAKHAVVPVAKPKVKVTAAAPAAPAAKPAIKPAVAKHVAKLPKGTPNTIGAQLALHGVVVVLLYNPKAKVDAYSLSEAALGASQAGAGFLSVNVLDQRQASPFTTAYGVLQDPTILFFVRPGKLVQKLVGFADHETVSQAATNEAAKVGWVPTRAQRTTSAASTSNLASWRTQAETVCASKQINRQPLTTTASAGQTKTYVRGMEKEITAVVAGLSALPLPAAASHRALVGSYLESLKTMRRDFESYLQARLKRDALATKARFGVAVRDEAKEKALAKQLGLTVCT